MVKGFIGLVLFMLLGTGIVDAYDQTFPTVKLRHGFQYKFNDTFNAGTYPVGLADYIVTFAEPVDGNYNGAANPKIVWTDEIKNKGYIINAYESVKAVISEDYYKIIYRPNVRKSDNLSITYDAKYKKKINGVWTGPNGTNSYFHHTEFQPYTITWCGDGVRDNYTDPTGYPVVESCDPNDTTKSGWGTGGCNNSCLPIEAQPVCNYITVPAPFTVQAPATKNVSCTATNATTIKVDCGNGQTQSFSVGTGTKTVSKTCNYINAGTYTPTCYVNDSITNNQCKKTIYVTDLKPSIRIVKTDANYDDEDTIVGNDTQTVLQGNEAIFNILVTNDGTEDLKNVSVTDPVAPQCNRIIGNLAVGQSHTFTCSKPNTQNAYTNTANVTGIGVTSNQNVNDTDPTRVLLVTPTCTSLSATPNSGIVEFTSNFNCTAQYADSYKIVVRDSSGNVITTINNNTGSYNFTQAGNYTASCFINNKTTTEQACITNIKAYPAPKPSITVDKRDANPADRDGIIGNNDSQTVYKGDDAVFKIRVTNNGPEDLKNIVLTDVKAPNCAGSVTLPGTKPSTFSNFNIGGNGNHNDSYLQPGEWFEYTCEKSNTLSSYTNVVGVNANGKTSNIPVDAHDPSSVRVVESSCTGLTVTPNTGTVSFVSNFYCTGDNVNTYKILVRDSSGNIVSTTNSNVGQYNFTQAGNYTVSCYVNNQTTTPTVCEKTVVANEDTNPSIKITKLDANDADSDGQIGNDTQTVVTGEKAVFRIIVENDGTEDLDTIVLTDAIAPNCAGSVTLPNTTPSTFTNFTVSGAGNNSDAILQPGERFEYTCEKEDTTTNYTNSATVDAESTVDDEKVDSTDTTVVKTGVYDLALLKKIINPQTSYNKDDVVEFEIEVHNQGTIDATDIVVTDYIPSELELKDVSWTQSGSLASRTIGDVAAGQIKTITITFTIIAADADIINWAEISSTGDSYADCDSTPDANQANDTYTTDDLIGSACNDTSGDEDDHDPATITVTPLAPSIMIEKYSNNIGTGSTDQDGNIEDSNANDSQTVDSGITALFTIKVINNGTEDLKDVTVTDILDGTAYTSCDKVIGDLMIGEVHTYTCEKSDTTKDYTNVAKVTGTGKTSNTPVTDEDDTQVVIKTITYKCDSLTASQTSGTVSFTSDFACSSNTTGSTYKIELKDASGNVIYTTDTASGNYTFSTKGNYTATCYIDGETTQANTACVQNISATSGGGGGSSTKCTSSVLSSVYGNVIEEVEDSRNNVRNIYYSGTGAVVDVTCNGFKEKSIIVDCGNGTTPVAKNSTGPATFRCEYDSSYTANNVFDIECRVAKNTNQGTDISDSIYKGGSFCTNSVQVGTGFCGDGIVNTGLGEECDSGSNNGPNNTCSLSCQLNGGGGGGGGGFIPNCENSFKYYNEHIYECDLYYTEPSGGDLMFGTAGKIVVGDSVDIFKGTDATTGVQHYDSREVYVENTGDEPLYIEDDFCVYNTALQADRVFVGQEQKECRGSDIQWIFPGERYTIAPTFVSDTGLIDGGKTQQTNELKITLEGYADAYFAESVDVTVAKPSLASRGGGTTYLSENTGTNTISNVSELAEAAGSNTEQSNFVATVLGDGNDLSNVETLDDEVLVEEAEDEGEAYSSGANDVVETTVSTPAASGDINDFGSYNGITNVFYAQDINITLGAESFSSTEPQTYIIQNGDLTLTGDITSLKNIAFIVKGGDILIDADVKSLDGTYVAITVDGRGGNITSLDDRFTNNQLSVNGSLFGDLNGLVSKRTYIAKETNGTIGVGTLISFGSSILNKPAPLVSQFIGEYMDSTRVAQ